MRRMLAVTTALALSLSAPAFAKMDQFAYNPTGEEIEASGFIGARVYTSETDVQDDTLWDQWDGSRQDWNDIGEIHDILMDDSGNIQAILVDVGGFLGIGEKQVAMSMDALRLKSDGEDADEYFVVVNSSREALEAAPQFESEDRAGLDVEGTNVTAAPLSAGTGNTAENGMATGTIVGDQTGSAEQPLSDDDGNGWLTANNDEMTAEKLTGARVYDANDNWIGEVDKLMLADSGSIDEAIIDVGGFLGIGEKSVAMNLDDLSIREATDGNEVRVYVDTTKDSLMDMPEYEG